MTDESRPPHDPAAAQSAGPLLECDLVMKGGVTSGVIYPKTVIALSSRYRFRNIGGTSAGAIAAAITAAAEYGRGMRDADGCDGFGRLQKLVAYLTEEKSIYNLFQPSAATKPLLAALLTYRGLYRVDEHQRQVKSNPLSALFKVLWAMFWSSPTGPLRVSALAGIGVGMILAALLLVLNIWAGGLAALLLFVLAICFGWLTGVLFGVYRLLTHTLPQQHMYGICRGSPPDTPSQAPPLTTWLADAIDCCAGLTDPALSEQNDYVYKELGLDTRAPLTFRHLKLNHHATQQEHAKIALNIVTTNISQRQPYTLPFTSGPFLFSEREFRELFPGYIVDFMVAVAKTNKPQDVTQCFKIVRRPDGDVGADPASGTPDQLWFLPRGDDLPVVVAARMSLSFPLLISAVPLWTISAAALQGPDRPPDQRIRPDELQRNWFSDGGVCSNFPIHFYDRWLPTRPTFGINLESLPEEFFDIPQRGGAPLIPTQLCAEEVLRRRSLIRPEAIVDSRDAPTKKDKAKDAAQSTVAEDARLQESVWDKSTWQVFRDLPEVDLARQSLLAQMPTSARADRPLPNWEPIDGSLTGFLLSMIYTGLFYRDGLLARLPSYYDRIVTIYHTDQEGGLAINMPAEVTGDIAERGARAAERILSKDTGEAGDPPGQQPGFSFDRHRWIRLRLMLAEMEAQLAQLRNSMLPPDDATQNNDRCPTRHFSQQTLDWNDPQIQDALGVLTQKLKAAHLWDTSVRDLIAYEHGHSSGTRPDPDQGPFSYRPRQAWTDSNQEATQRFVLLQLLVERWAKRNPDGTYETFFQDETAPPRDGMSMRITPEL